MLFEILQLTWTRLQNESFVLKIEGNYQNIKSNSSFNTKHSVVSLSDMILSHFRHDTISL